IGKNTFCGFANVTSVTIPNSVTSIGNSSFSGCSGLTSVTIPNSVTSIANNAFNGCSGLTNVTIPNSVTSIGDGAFASCTGLASVTIPNSVTSIANNEFNGCSGLTNVTIPNSVTSIGDGAFAGCNGLTSVTLPNSVTNIGINAFANCSNLASVTFTPGTANNTLSIGEEAFDSTKEDAKVAYANGENTNKLFDGTNKITTDTLLTDIQGKTLTWKADVQTWTSGNCTVTLDSAGTLTVSKTEGAENGNMANYSSFSNRPWNNVRDQITSVVIENGVTSIGQNAFRLCQNMINVAIADTVTGIEESAFYGCTGLTSVTLPNSVTTIGGGAFEECGGLTNITIPNSVTTIKSYAFHKCSNLANVTFTPAAADTTLAIGNNAFANTKSGAKVAYADGENTNKLFDGNNKITTDTLLIDIQNKTLTWKADVQTWTSGNCTVTLDDEGTLTVSKTEGAENGNMADYESINNRPWYGVREQITSVEIKDGVTSIGASAFYNCSNLASVTIPNSVTSIGFDAFYGCSNLENVTIPNSVTTIVGSAFENCSGLTSITIPNSVTSIDGYAFYGCSNLVSVTFTPATADTTLTIGSNAFKNTKAGAKVAYADGDTMLFDGTNKITTDTLLTDIQYKTLTWKNTIVGRWTSGDCTVTLDDEGKLTVSKTEGKENGNMANYSSFSDIPWYQSREQITSIEIKDGVTSIGEAAFAGCSNLENVTIPNSVTSIGEAAFYGCSNLASVTIPNSVTSIGNFAFYGCSNLANVTIPNSVTNIGAFAFVGCSGLTSVTIPNSVTSIGDAAFAGCSNLENVTIPNSVTSIGGGVFSGCSGLTNVTIPSSVTSIGDAAFAYCSNLASVTFTPGAANNTLWIGEGAFYGTKAGTKVAYADGDTMLFDGTTKITTDTLLTAIQDKSLTWKVPVDVTGIELNKNETTIIRGSDETLTATVSPDNAIIKSVEWTSSNEEVATVDSTGKVTAIKAGTVTITATATNGTASTSDDKTATCTVKVKEVLNAENITIDDVTYNGVIHRPVLKFDDDTVLKEGRDYEIVPTNGDIANAQDVGRYTIHINGKGDYVGENIALTWRIVKADYTVADIFAMKPSAKTVTYNGEDQEVIQAPEVMPYFGTEISYKVSDRKLTANELAEFYSNNDGWTDSAENLKQKDAGTYYYYFKISDPNHNAYPNGNQFTVVDAEFLCLTAVIEKADPEFGSDITGTSLNCGQSLENSTINGESTVPGTFTWKDDSIVPKVSDSNITEYDAVFTPNDTDNYNTVDVKVKVIVSSANKNDLEYTIGEAEEYYNDIKEDEAYAEPAGELDEAIQSAKAVFNNTDATEDEVDEAYNDLADAVDKAEDDVDKIDDENAAKAVDDKIDEIGEVELTDACKAKIEDAKEALDDLTLDQKKLVKNKNVIDYAQKAYDALVAEAEAKSAEARANTTANEMRQTATRANNAKIAAENAKKAAEDAQKIAEDAKKVAQDKQKEAEDALAQGLADANDKVEKANKAKVDAEEAQQKAESKQADAENKLANAEKAKAEAEQAKEEAEKAQQEAEQARQTAEEKQAEAEQAQKEAEDKQKAAEEALENGQAEAEDKVTEAEQAQKEAEDKQKAAEDKQKEAEDKLKAAEEALAKAQADAEQAKKTADEKLAAAEKAQKAAEDAREKGLADADEKVKAAEQAQKEAEDAKKAAEEKQADAEKAKKEADAVAASVVSDVLNALPDAKDITKDNAADVEAARKAYDKLNDAQKALVNPDALQKLTDDEKAVAALNDDGDKIVKGDANGDGKVDVTDIAMIAAHIKGIKPLSENGFKAADVNGDGKVDVTDIALVASHIKGIKALQ
ncbi:MAG: leucine-rich repeat protein, partial [Ruminococcus sp.]|nr:leucine-rich repeat protein [Ruminococcus sp.]